ncbi:chaplin family protein [Streptomyces sp. NPDC001889]
MRQLHRRGLATVMLTGGALAMAGPAQADAVADGGTAGSPGVISGNTVQLPVHLPVSVCGNTVNVVGLLNPAAGNTCENTSRGDQPPPGSSANGGGAVAQGGAANSPGVDSGNSLQLPIDLPVNVTGNSVNAVGLLNPAVGNTSANVPAEPTAPKPPTRPAPVTPPKTVPPPETAVPPREPEAPAAVTPADSGPSPASGPTRVLAETGTGDGVGYAVPAGAALLLAGTALLRHGRGSRRAES